MISQVTDGLAQDCGPQTLFTGDRRALIDDGRVQVEHWRGIVAQLRFESDPQNSLNVETRRVGRPIEGCHKMIKKSRD
jgi:hypothetical protein